MGTLSYEEITGKHFAKIMNYLESSENIERIGGQLAYKVTLVQVDEVYTTHELATPQFPTSHVLERIVLAFHNPETAAKDARKIEDLLCNR